MAPKTGFRVPAAEWLRGPLAPVIDSQLEGGAAYGEGWLSRAATARLWAEHRGGRRDWTTLLWPALAFGLWLDRVQGVRDPDQGSAGAGRAMYPVGSLDSGNLSNG